MRELSAVGREVAGVVEVTRKDQVVIGVDHFVLVDVDIDVVIVCRVARNGVKRAGEQQVVVGVDDIVTVDVTVEQLDVAEVSRRTDCAERHVTNLLGKEGAAGVIDVEGSGEECGNKRAVCIQLDTLDIVQAGCWRYFVGELQELQLRNRREVSCRTNVQGLAWSVEDHLTNDLRTLREVEVVPVTGTSCKSSTVGTKSQALKLRDVANVVTISRISVEAHRPGFSCNASDEVATAGLNFAERRTCDSVVIHVQNVLEVVPLGRVHRETGVRINAKAANEVAGTVVERSTFNADRERSHGWNAGWGQESKTATECRVGKVTCVAADLLSDPVECTGAGRRETVGSSVEVVEVNASVVQAGRGRAKVLEHSSGCTVWLILDRLGAAVGRALSSRIDCSSRSAGTGPAALTKNACSSGHTFYRVIEIKSKGSACGYHCNCDHGNSNFHDILQGYVLNVFVD